MDAQVERLLKNTLRETDLDRNTIFVFTSDQTDTTWAKDVAKKNEFVSRVPPVCP